jgi:hypothetical protein
VAPLLDRPAVLGGQDLPRDVVDPRDVDLVPPGRDDTEEQEAQPVGLPLREPRGQDVLRAEPEEPLRDVAQGLRVLDGVPGPLRGERQPGRDPDDQGTTTP